MTSSPGGERSNHEPCRVCGHDRSCVVTVGEDYEYHTLPGPFTYVRCSRCEHFFLDPLPPAEELGTIYPPTYYTVNTASPLHLQGWIYAKKMQRDVSRIVSIMDGRPIRSVVDLGCGDGERLARVGEALGEGVELIGVDLQPSQARMSELEGRGVKLVQGNIEGELDVLRDGGHDLMIMSQIIEHLREPVKALHNLPRKLSPGGRLLIETPHVGGFDYALFKRKNWGGYHIPRHFHLFTQSSMTKLVEAAGLRVTARGFMPSPGFWITSLRNALGLDSVAWSKRFGEFLNYSNFPSVGFFTALDLTCIRLGLPTSTQFIVGERAA
jgi:SAM-dependent methyltransferase